jgi:arylsulfatase A-like enzyme/thioredoxin-like negative regulator of GroEL
LEPRRASILLVTLDTTRADAIGPEAVGITTPGFDALASRGRRFRHAYATAPETLPSHASMLTGLFPAGHGVRENGRRLSDRHGVLAERLRAAGYRTAAFVSAFVLDRRFGLDRGFEVYDDDMPEGDSERTALATTDRAVAFLERTPERATASPPASTAGPLFLWVHYYDPHAPYEPPEPFRGRHPESAYLGEVAAMDAQLGRLATVFSRQASGPVASVVVADHGEGLGDHGEAGHGKLLYQSTMRVPLTIAGSGIDPGTSDAPVSARRVFHTILDLAGLEAESSLRSAQPEPELVLGEAMKPFLAYGWQPQAMAVEGRHKAILAGAVELYDLAADPGETQPLAGELGRFRRLRDALREYPVPSLVEHPVADEGLGAEQRRRLASLGYVAATTHPVVRPDAPRPAEMTPLFDTIDLASTLFVSERYEEVIPLLGAILERDPHNLDSALRLATAHSALGHDRQAVAAFQAAAAIAPDSPDVHAYLGLHYAKGAEWRRAEPLLERVLSGAPDRLPALEALAVVRERQGRTADAIALRRRIHVLRDATAPEQIRLGELAMGVQQTALAIEAFEAARRLAAGSFDRDLELGVLYLAARRLEDARSALDRVPSNHPALPMALFKRAQVSVLLGEPDRRARIEAARRGADATTRELIENERLFEAP